jgi:hypothetical protein
MEKVLKLRNADERLKTGKLYVYMYFYLSISFSRRFVTYVQ